MGGGGGGLICEPEPFVCEPLIFPAKNGHNAFNGLDYMQYTYTRSAIGHAKRCSGFFLILVINGSTSVLSTADSDLLKTSNVSTNSRLQNRVTPLCKKLSMLFAPHTYQIF